MAGREIRKWDCYFILTPPNPKGLYLQAALTETYRSSLVLFPLRILQVIVPSRVSSRGYEIGPVCVSVCLLVSALPAESFDIRTKMWWSG